MHVLTSPTFERHVKKLHAPEKRALDQAVREVARDPSIGEAKKGDLEGIYVYKYRNGSQLWLLAYSVESEDQVTLRLAGPHENFYKSLKRNKGV